MQSPLHVAANFGHVNFTNKLIEKKPKLVEVVDQIKRSSPLHIACAEGHLQIVKTLLGVNSSICYTHDQDGKTPVHVAAINGQIDVLGALLNVEPQAARERTMGGESVLHLCVKHKQPEALRFLVKTINDGELLNFDDAVGNTVLHLAVAAKQPEMVEIIILHPKIKKNAVNKNGLTVVDTHKQSRKDSTQDKKIWILLNRANVLPAKEALKTTKDRAWLEDRRTSLMVVASLIATMAFQVGINPPGGVWQDKKTYTSQQDIKFFGLQKDHIAYAGTSRPSMQAIFNIHFEDNPMDFCHGNNIDILVLGIQSNLWRRRNLDCIRDFCRSLARVNGIYTRGTFFAIHMEAY
uniref:PGG domain-containing protein n=1 Tax=Chenopodium quinoa TaxID=63459 RepID=A0A803N971_CHEQI